MSLALATLVLIAHSALQLLKTQTRVLSMALATLSLESVLRATTVREVTFTQFHAQRVKSTISLVSRMSQDARIVQQATIVMSRH